MKKHATTQWIIPMTALSLFFVSIAFYQIFVQTREPKATIASNHFESMSTGIIDRPLQKKIQDEKRILAWIQDGKLENAKKEIQEMRKKNPEESTWKRLEVHRRAKTENPALALDWFKNEFSLENQAIFDLYAQLSWEYNLWERLEQENVTDRSPEWQELNESLQLLLQGELNKSLEKFSKIKKQTLGFEKLIQSMQALEKETRTMQGEKESYQMASILQNLNQTGAFKIALRLSPSFLEKYSGYRDLWLLTGQASLLNQDWDQAIRELQESLKIDATNPIASYYLGFAFMKKAAYPEAVEAFEIALLYGFTEEALLYPEIAMAHYKLGHDEEALKSFEYILAKNSQKAEDFKLAIWLALEKIKDEARATKLAQICMKRYPQEALSHQFQAILALKKDQKELAYKAIQKALELDPNLAEAHLSAGILLESNQEQEKARWEYEKALKLAEPDSLASKEARLRLDALDHATKP